MISSANGLTVRPAGLGELHRVVLAYTAAFADEAVAVWVIPDAARRGELATDLYQDYLAQALDRDEVLIAEHDGGIAGVSVWTDLDSPERIRREAAELTELAAARPDFARVATVMGLVAARHPEAPHVYLPSIGVLPEQRGRGVASAILRHRLARADQLARPVYLEASTPRNEKLYARHGFQPLGEPIVLPDGGPRPQPMWRTPRQRDQA
ncbi:GNAT family N-acetyltransferase [Saccharopolyspora sp. 5N708]|uniref:GNAT family N-acetyltransferase n=1 Tax=Saccharopolyspora sp. 5N708 TaxID=3457424 RepID=UPI003FD2206E